MSKTLVLLTPAAISEENVSIGPSGHKAAATRGMDLGNKVIKIGQLFYYPPVPSTLETAISLMIGWARRTGAPQAQYPTPMPVYDVNNRHLTSATSEDGFLGRVRNGDSELNALRTVREPGQINVWAKKTLGAINTLFASMADGEISVGILEPLPITLAALAANGFEDLPKGLDRLAPLEGLVFERYGNDGVKVAGKIARGMTQDSFRPYSGWFDAQAKKL